MITSSGNRNPENADRGGSQGRGRLDSFTRQASRDLANTHFNRARTTRAELHRSEAFSAEILSVALIGELTAVMHQEAAGAAEFIGQHRDDRDGEFLVGQVRSRQFEGLGRLRLVDIDSSRLRRDAAGLEFLQAVLVDVDYRAARFVVVRGSRHRFHSLPSTEGGVTNSVDEGMFPPIKRSGRPFETQPGLVR
jgi:hypothetical protein